MSTVYRDDATPCAGPIDRNMARRGAAVSRALGPPFAAHKAAWYRARERGDIFSSSAARERGDSFARRRSSLLRLPFGLDDHEAESSCASSAKSGIFARVRGDICASATACVRGDICASASARERGDSCASALCL